MEIERKINTYTDTLCKSGQCNICKEALNKQNYCHYICKFCAHDFGLYKVDDNTKFLGPCCHCIYSCNYTC